MSERDADKRPEPLDRGDIIRHARILRRDAMYDYMKRKYGVSAKDVPAVLGGILPKESDYQRNIIGHLKERYKGAFVWKAAAGPYSQGGIPDVCAVIEGQFFAFEVKRPILGKASKLQEKAIEDINAAGGHAAVISYPEEADVIIGAWLRRREP